MTTERSRVLVVEDRPSVLKLMSVILGAVHEVTMTCDAPAALATIAAARVDVVLSDVRLPGGSGFDILRSVHDRGLSTEVVLMTGYPSVPDAVAAIKLGAFDYVTKPIEAAEIALVVARAVSRARAEHPIVLAPASAEEQHDVAKRYRCVVEEARERASRRYLVDLMRSCRGNVTAAALHAGMTRESLHRLLKRYDVHSVGFKPPSESEPVGDEPRAIEG
jgi:DNA-binding NtrC family response regulator